MSEFDQALLNLRTLRSSFAEISSNRNEAETRKHFVDRLIYECLDWGATEVTLEQHHQKEYSDYICYCPRASLIVEAKREGKTFEVPAGFTHPKQLIKSLCKNNRDLEEAIDQVSGYCFKRGVPYAAVTNGHQVVFFVALRTDGQPPMDGHALVFPSLKFIEDNFLKFWNCLSKPGIQEDMGMLYLFPESQPKLPSPLSSSIQNFPGNKNRNTFQADLQALSEVVLEDIARSPELEEAFLEECYCKPGKYAEYSLATKRLINTRYESLFEGNTPGPAITSVSTKKEAVSSEFIGVALSGRPIFLIGDVGVGKSMFIRHFIKVEAKAEIKKSVIVYVDLGREAMLTHDIKGYVIDAIVEQLLNNYEIDVFENCFVRSVYDGDLKRFAKGTKGSLKESDPAAYAKEEINFLTAKEANTTKHLQACVKHIHKGRTTDLLIFLDNTDQRGPVIQDETILIAQEFASNWPFLVFVPVRPESFHRSTRSGALSGYHPKAFTVSPPGIVNAISKRLKFAKKITSGEVEIPNLHAMGDGRVHQLETLIDCFLSSLDNSPKLADCIENISGGNVRLSLDLVRWFFGSGHVDTKKIVNRLGDGSGYHIPLHEFLRTVIFRDHEYFSEANSVACNIYDIRAKDIREHFCLPILLGFLRKAQKTQRNSGFVTTSDIYDSMQQYGFTPSQIDFAVGRALRKKLIESETRADLIPSKSEDKHVFRTTTTGLYHYSKLAGSYLYIDAIVTSVPVLQREFREKIKNAYSLDQKLERAEIFRKYLDEAWRTGEFDSPEFRWDRLSTELSRDIKAVTQRLERGRSRGHGAKPRPNSSPPKGNK